MQQLPPIALPQSPIRDVSLQRAQSKREKHDICDIFYGFWSGPEANELRIGQLLSNALTLLSQKQGRTVDLFYLEDWDLVDAVIEYILSVKCQDLAEELAEVEGMDG